MKTEWLNEKLKAELKVEKGRGKSRIENWKKILQQVKIWGVNKFLVWNFISLNNTKWHNYTYRY